MGWTNEKHGGQKSRDKLPLKQNHSVGFENHVDQNLDVSFDKKKEQTTEKYFLFVFGSRPYPTVHWQIQKTS